MTFLFDPHDVAKHLSTLPRLRAALVDPLQEGEQSSAFPQARKSEREIYRVLGNKNHQHLTDLLQTLNFCLGRGFTQSTILRTRARKSFAESLAELNAAEHFLLDGFEVAGPVATKYQEAVPDFIAKRHDITTAVEVYCPRVWEGLSDLEDGLKDVVKNLDKPFDYNFEVRMHAKSFHAHKRLPMPHPGEISDALTKKVCEGLTVELCDKLSSGLDASLPTITVEQKRPDLNIGVSTVLSSIKVSRGRLAVRCGHPGYFSRSGYAPEGIFKSVVDRVKRKAQKCQAVGYAQVSLLIVDLSYSGITSELDHSYYSSKFTESIKSRLGLGLGGYDMVAFVEMPGWRCRLRPHFLVREEHVSEEIQRLLFGKRSSGQEAKCLKSGFIFCV